MSAATEPRAHRRRTSRGARRLLAHRRRRRRAARRRRSRTCGSRAATRARAACPPGAGSGVVLTPDGFLLTSAHVVAGRDARRAAPLRRRPRVQLRRSSARDPLSDLAVLRADGDGPRAGDARRRRARCASASSWSRSATRNGFAGSVTAGVVSGARPLAARARGPRGADHRQRDPDRRRAQPRQLRRRAGRRPRAGRRRQHGGRRRRPRPRGPDQRRHAAA